MSDRLAIAAAASILMMSVYVLFGSDTQRVPLSQGARGVAAQLSAPAVSLDVLGLLR